MVSKMPTIDYYGSFLGQVFDGDLVDSNRDQSLKRLKSPRTFFSTYKNYDTGNEIIERRRSLPEHHDGLPTLLKKDIRDSFHILDTNADGLVSRYQVEGLIYKIDPDMTHEEMEDLLDTADLDGDGMYDMDEYLFLMYLKWNDQESVTDIKEAFKVFDKDSSGALSREEFAFILKKLGEPLSDGEVDEILDHFDKDGSGEIDFDEFAYVMTGPHVNETGGFDAGIPLQYSHALDKLNPPQRAVTSPVSRSASRKSKHKPADSGKHREEKSPLAGVYGRRIINSDVERGRDTVKFRKSGPDTARSKQTHSSKKIIKSAAELRPLGTARPLTGGKLVVPEKPKAKPAPQLRPDVVIERYHDLYGKKPASVKKHSQGDTASHISLDSDNFSMCSDVIRHMNTHAEHYVPDSDEEDDYHP